MTSTPGQIITFYSYKGGTGRSMALANVACLVADGAVTEPVSRPVLMIDWDLEAPGLHRYFQDYLPTSAGSLLGVIDLFEDLDRELRARGAKAGEDSDDLVARVVGALDWSRYVARTTLPNLQLMRAGRADASYAGRVSRFDWEGLFSLAPSLMTTLAERLSLDFSFVFVDSRTGHTDIKEICTTLLPDKLALVFTPNQQSIHGAIEVGRSAVSYRMASDDLRPLVVFPLVSRVEAQLDDLRELWRRGDATKGIPGFQPAFQEFFRQAYTPRPMSTVAADGQVVADVDALMSLALERYFDEVQIQQSAPLAYGEPIAALIRGGDRLSLSRSYLAFAQRLITTQGPWAEGGPEDLDFARRLVARHAEREAIEAKHERAERLWKWAPRIVPVAVLFAFGLFVHIEALASRDHFRAASSMKSRELAEREAKVHGLQGELQHAQAVVAAVREETKILAQVEQAAASARSLEEFTFPPRPMAKQPTPELKAKCHEALKTFATIVAAANDAQSGLEKAVAAAQAGDVQSCQDEACTSLRDIVAASARRTLAKLRERSQVLLPSLLADRDFWQQEAAGWRDSPVTSPEPDAAARAAASAKWEEGYKVYLTGDLTKARALYTEAKALDPTYAPPYNSLAVLELAQGNLATALGLIEETLARDSAYPPAYSNRALIYLNLATQQPAGSEAWTNLIKSADEGANRALQLRPGYSAPLSVKERINSLKKSVVTKQQGMQVQGPPPIRDKGSPDLDF